jgi:hypothetical protein
VGTEISGTAMKIARRPSKALEDLVEFAVREPESTGDIDEMLSHLFPEELTTLKKVVFGLADRIRTLDAIRNLKNVS